MHLYFGKLNRGNGCRKNLFNCTVWQFTILCISIRRPHNILKVHVFVTSTEKLRLSKEKINERPKTNNLNLTEGRPK